MDTNYLLKREQISLMMARNASCASSRHAHAGLARAYGALLATGTFPHRSFGDTGLDPSETPDRGRADT
jgi:hypothetical protein